MRLKFLELDINALAGGGLFSAPDTILPDNSAQLAMLQQQSEQNQLLMSQQQMTMSQQTEADMAALEQQSELAMREAQERVEREEREDRMRKGKKDLLYRSALGVDEEEDEEEGSLLKLGGA